MEDFQQYQVEQAVTQALGLGAISFDVVKMLLLARLENRPARLDLSFTLICRRLAWAPQIPVRIWN
jgi:hypothetical protein